MIARAALAALVHDCFLRDVSALKPGNVGEHGAGHDMTCDHFIESARVATPILCDARLGVGARILAAVRATRAAAHCNTNLGMLLLLAPIIKTAEGITAPAEFRAGLLATLASLGREDSRHIFAAIRLARPGGLGRVEKHDVNAPGNADIRAAMEAARDRDLVALQYAGGYQEAAGLGVACMRTYDQRWNSVEWAMVACYLTLLAHFPDSHVRRRHGAAAAERVRKKAALVLNRFVGYNEPRDATGRLLVFDRQLKEAGVNPGACADLTVASLLLYRLGVG